MTENKIGDEEAKAMSEMLKKNTTLTKLNLESEEEEINGKEKEIEKRMTDNGHMEGAKALEEKLEKNTTLTSLQTTSKGGCNIQ